jgi:hypothetical protein
MAAAKKPGMLQEKGAIPPGEIAESRPTPAPRVCAPGRGRPRFAPANRAATRTSAFACCATSKALANSSFTIGSIVIRVGIWHVKLPHKW